MLLSGGWGPHGDSGWSQQPPGITLDSSHSTPFETASKTSSGRSGVTRRLPMTEPRVISGPRPCRALSGLAVADAGARCGLLSMSYGPMLPCLMTQTGPLLLYARTKLVGTNHRHSCCHTHRINELLRGGHRMNRELMCHVAARIARSRLRHFSFALVQFSCLLIRTTARSILKALHFIRQDRYGRQDFRTTNTPHSVPASPHLGLGNRPSLSSRPRTFSAQRPSSIS